MTVVCIQILLLFIRFCLQNLLYIVTVSGVSLFWKLLRGHLLSGSLYERPFVNIVVGKLLFFQHKKVVLQYLTGYMKFRNNMDVSTYRSC